MSIKTNVNNLNIVWQGQSWSVISPNGVVLARFKDKQEAKVFAGNIKEYLSGVYPEYDEDDFYQVLRDKPDYVVEQLEKRKNSEPEKLKNGAFKTTSDFEVYKNRVRLFKSIVGIPLIVLLGPILTIGVLVSLLNVLRTFFSSGLEDSLFTIAKSLTSLLPYYEALAFAWWYVDQYKPHSPTNYISDGDRKKLLQLTIALPVMVITGTALLLGVIVGIGHFIYLIFFVNGDAAFNFLAIAFLWCVISTIILSGTIKYLDDF